MTPFTKCNAATKQAWIPTPCLRHLCNHGPRCVTALNNSSHTNLIKQANLSPKQDKCQISVSPLWVFPIFLLVPCAGVGTAGTCQAGDVTMMAEPQHRAGRNSLLAVCRSQETIHSTLNDLYNFLGQAPGL